MRLKWLLVFFSLFISTFSSANLFNKQNAFLAAKDAFRFSYQQSEQQLTLHWQIAEGYYLYKKEIAINGENIGEFQLPLAQPYHDEFFGQVEIYQEQLTISLPIIQPQQENSLEITYQGCTKGFCYPPETIHLKIEPSNNINLITDANNNQIEFTQTESKNISLFWFFFLGIGLAFTPCVLPMLPLLSALIIGNQHRPNNLQAFLLSFSYVQGMAFTYTLLGLLIASLGLSFQIALQSSIVLILFSLLFILLACSMFGLFNLALPHSLQQKLNQFSQKQQGGSFIQVFMMGSIAGLIASPCTSAPLSGALLYVAQSGDLITGGAALYLLALGMGLPLILVTLFGHNILPKSGDWLLKVKTLFGFVMLTLPIFLLSRLLPDYIEPLMWSALAIAFLIWLHEQFLSPAQAWKKVIRILLLGLLLISAKPWLDFITPSTNSSITNEKVNFVKITSLKELEQQLIANKQKKVMLDFYADWCVACKEFEKYTFPAPQVKNKLDEMLLLQIDMTRNAVENNKFLQHYNILGLPTILFFDENGIEIKEARIIGFMAAKEFGEKLKQLSQ